MPTPLYYGWGDVDVVYGDIRRFLTPQVLDHDLITFDTQHLTGHLTFARVSPKTENMLVYVPDWKKRLSMWGRPQLLDEPHPDSLRPYMRVHAERSYNTPLSRITPWRDGTFRFPTEWYWKDGKLTNNLDRNKEGQPLEFLYLHFQHYKDAEWSRICGNAQWKGLERIVNLEPDQLRYGFRMNDRGFSAF